MADDVTVQPLALTDDEVMGLAAVSARAWWTALRTVDVTDEDDMVRAAGRGLRSLAVRGLVHADGEPDDVLALATTCLGHKPWATAAAVDVQDRIPADAPILSVFRAASDGPLTAVRSDASGTHVFHELHLEHAVELVAEQLSTPAGSDIAAAFWSSDRRAHGGLRRRGDTCVRVDIDGHEIEPVGAVGDAAAMVDAVRGYWTT